MASKPNIIAIGYAKRALKEGSREQERMLMYAREFGEYHVIVFTRSSEKLPTYIQKENLHLYGTNTSTKLGMILSAIKIGRRILRQNKQPFVVSSQDPFETSLVGRCISFTNSATNHIQVHGDVFNPHSYKTSILQRVRHVFGVWSVRHVPAIRVVSNRIKKSLVTLGVNESRITVLPIQVSLSDFYQAGEKRVYAEKTHLSFLYVGRFSPEKNLQLLLGAFSEVVATYPNCSFTLVGEGAEKNSLHTFVKKVGIESKVIFKSWTEDVVAEMSAHDVFCLTSNHEGWAMVLLEAAATGMGIVSTDVGCVGEVILEKQNGKVVPVGNQKALVEAMKWCVENPDELQKMQKNAHVSVAQYAENQSLYLKDLVDSYTS